MSGENYLRRILAPRRLTEEDEEALGQLLKACRHEYKFIEDDIDTEVYECKRCGKVVLKWRGD